MTLEKWKHIQARDAGLHLHKQKKEHWVKHKSGSSPSHPKLIKINTPNHDCLMGDYLPLCDLEKDTLCLGYSHHSI